MNFFFQLGASFGLRNIGTTQKGILFLVLSFGFLFLLYLDPLIFDGLLFIGEMQSSLLMLLDVFLVVWNICPTKLAPFSCPHSIIKQQIIKSHDHLMLGAMHKAYLRRDGVVDVEQWMYNVVCGWWLCGDKLNIIIMSIQRQDQSPQFRIKQKVVAKVNYNSKLLPLDFFPHTLSSSPKKRKEIPSSSELLEEWFNREQNTDKPQKLFKRLPNHKISINEIQLCELKKQSLPKQRQEDRKYTYNHYSEIKEYRENTLKYPLNPEKRANNHLLPKQSLVKLVKNSSIFKIEKDSRSRGRSIRSEGKLRRRYDESQQKVSSSSKNTVQQRLSLKQMPKKCTLLNSKKAQTLGVGFDGLITFSRFK